MLERFYVCALVGVLIKCVSLYTLLLPSIFGFSCLRIVFVYVTVNESATAIRK